MQTYIGAEFAHCLNLQLIHVLGGRINNYRRVEEPAAVSDRLPVIACRGCYDCLPTITIGGFVANQVDSAAHLERAYRLQVFEFCVVVAPEFIGDLVDTY